MISILGALVAIGCLLVVLPIATIADTATRDNGRKRSWIAAIVVLWPMGSVLYGVFGTTRAPLRVLTAIVLAGNAALLWMGHVNAAIESPDRTPTLEHYEAVAASDRLELQSVFGSYGSPGNDDYVQALSLSSDGSRLVVSGGRSLRVWDVPRAEPVVTYEALPANDILAGWLYGRWLGRGDAVAMSPDGAIVAAGRGSVSLRLGLALVGLARDAVDGRGRGVVEVFDGDGVDAFRWHRSNVSGLEIRDNRLITASYDGTIAIWNLDTSHRVREIEAHTGWIRHFAVSPDGALALAAWHDPYPASGPSGGLTLWDLSTGAPRAELTTDGDDVIAVGFSDDGQYALGASFECLRKWRTAGTLVHTTRGADPFTNVVFSPTGRYALSGKDVVELWDIEGERITDRVSLRSSDDAATASVFDANESSILIGTKRGAVLRFQLLP